MRHPGWILPLGLMLAAVSAVAAPEGAASTKPAEGKLPPDTVNAEGVLLRLDDVDIGTVIELYSRITGKILLPAPDLRGKITIINRERLQPIEAARLIESALELQGWTTIPQGKVVRLVKSREAVKRLVPTSEPPSEKVLKNMSRMETFMVPVRYVKGEDVRSLITPLLSNDATIQFNERTNLLVITEVGTNMARLLELIQKVDRPLSSEEDAFETVELHHVDPKRMQDDVSAYFKNTNINFLPVERLQTLVVNGKKPDVERARRLINLLDKPANPELNVNQIVSIKYAKAPDIADLLLKLYKERSEAPPASFSINADKASNTIVITGPPQLRAEIAGVIAQLDQRFKQVLLKVLIGEVNNMPSRQLGVQWEFLRDDSNVAQNFTGVTGNDATSLAARRATAGIRYSVIHPAGFNTFVAGLESSNNFSVLASPQITVATNKPATFKVADQVPIQTANRISDNSNIQVQSTDFKEAGLTLKVTPQITPDNEVTLDLDFIFSEVGARDPVFQNPTFVTRETHTTVLVKDDHTLVMAGLMRRDHTRAQTQTPFFGRLPVLGPLFRLRSDTSLKQEIMVLLTPTVLSNTREEDSVTDMYVDRGHQVDAHPSFRKSYRETLHYLECESRQGKLDASCEASPSTTCAPAAEARAALPPPPFTPDRGRAQPIVAAGPVPAAAAPATPGDAAAVTKEAVGLDAIQALIDRRHAARTKAGAAHSRSLSQ